MKSLSQLTITLMAGLFLVLTVFWGCGTTRSVSGSNAALPQSQYIDNSKVTFVDNVSPTHDRIKSTMAGVVSANAVVKIYDSNDVLITQGTADAGGNFDIDFDDNKSNSLPSSTVFLTTTTPGFSESLANFVNANGSN
jgi:hypothetical protein